MFKIIWAKIKRAWKWLVGGVVIATVGTGLVVMNVGGPVEPPEPLPSTAENANLIIYQGDDPSGSFEDGDIFLAINVKRMLDVNTQMIIGQNFENAPRNKDTYVIPDSLEDVYMANTMEYKFERISETEVKRTDLTDNSYAIFSNVPNENNEYMWVQEHIDHLMSSPRHKVFGTKGQEYWYGGKTLTDLDRLDTIWVEIEKRTEHRKVDNLDYNFAGDKYLRIKVDDFDDATRSELESSITADSGGELITLKERKYKVDYKSLNIESKYNRTDIVQTK
jgi:hypothetical protein